MPSAEEAQPPRGSAAPEGVPGQGFTVLEPETEPEPEPEPEPPPEPEPEPQLVPVPVPEPEPEPEPEVQPVVNEQRSDRLITVRFRLQSVKGGVKPFSQQFPACTSTAAVHAHLAEIMEASGMSIICRVSAVMHGLNPNMLCCAHE